eukprot:78621-Chlamydomonas_euryale.AAC.2
MDVMTSGIARSLGFTRPVKLDYWRVFANHVRPISVCSVAIAWSVIICWVRRHSQGGTDPCHPHSDLLVGQPAAKTGTWVACKMRRHGVQRHDPRSMHSEPACTESCTNKRQGRGMHRERVKTGAHTHTQTHTHNWGVPTRTAGEAMRQHLLSLLALVMNCVYAVLPRC